MKCVFFLEISSVLTKILYDIFKAIFLKLSTAQIYSGFDERIILSIKTPTKKQVAAEMLL